MNEMVGVANKIKSGRSPVLVSVVVPVFNGGKDFDRCLGAVFRTDWPAFECIVVDDASSDKLTAEIARRHGAHLVCMEQRCGPAVARNTGVSKARGEIIFFTDADVLLHPDAMGRAVTALESDPDLAAVFGSYDDTPGHGSFLSRYRNLYHHWNHQVGNEEASTFWTGCGAIRREVFLEMGGFSSNYTRPSIEDIELGYRLREAGYRIRLLKTMLGTHLKQWKFRDMLLTDVFRRGVPWTELLLRYRSAPADLNLNLRARAATVSAALLLVIMLLLPLASHVKAIVPTLALFLAAVICSRLTKDSNPKNTSSAGFQTHGLCCRWYSLRSSFGLRRDFIIYFQNGVESVLPSPSCLSKCCSSWAAPFLFRWASFSGFDGVETAHNQAFTHCPYCGSGGYQEEKSR